MYIEDGASPNTHLLEVAIDGSIEGFAANVAVLNGFSVDEYRAALEGIASITAMEGTSLRCGRDTDALGCTTDSGFHMLYASDLWPCDEIIISHELAHAVGFLVGLPDRQHSNQALFGAGSVYEYSYNRVSGACYAGDN